MVKFLENNNFQLNNNFNPFTSYQNNHHLFITSPDIIMNSTINENKDINNSNSSLIKKRKSEYVETTSPDNTITSIKQLQGNPFLINNNNNNVNSSSSSNLNNNNNILMTFTSSTLFNQQLNNNNNNQNNSTSSSTNNNNNFNFITFTPNITNIITNQTTNKRQQIRSKDEEGCKYLTITPTVKEKSYGDIIKQSLVSKRWRELMSGEFDKPYFRQLISFLDLEKDAGHLICPSEDQVFRCFNMTPFDNVKVVILGQDPSHATDLANGLSFSFGQNNQQQQQQQDSYSTQKINNLINNNQQPLYHILKELKSDLGVCTNTKHGALDKWASQGVFLLNGSLTIRKGSADAHNYKGWEVFTDMAISMLSAHRRDRVIFLLWGKAAQEKASLIDRDKHTVLTASYPSNFLAPKGFYGCKHFSSTNSILTQNSTIPIDWNLDDQKIIDENNNKKD